MGKRERNVNIKLNWQVPEDKQPVLLILSGAEGGAAGVSSLNALIGALTLTAGPNITINSAGTDVSITGSAGGGVTSFNTRTGAVVPVTNDYTWAQVDKTTSNIADIATRSHTSLTDIGSNSHVAIDTHIADGTLHFPLTGSEGNILFNSGSAALGVSNNLFWNNNVGRLSLASVSPSALPLELIQNSTSTSGLIALRMDHVTSAAAGAGLGTIIEFRNNVQAAGLERVVRLTAAVDNLSDQGRFQIQTNSGVGGSGAWNVGGTIWMDRRGYVSFSPKATATPPERPVHIKAISTNPTEMLVIEEDTATNYTWQAGPYTLQIYRSGSPTTNPIIDFEQTTHVMRATQGLFVTPLAGSNSNSPRVDPRNTTTNPSFGWSDAGMGMYRSANDEISWCTATVQRMILNSVGQLGLGIAPTERLTVSGSIVMQGSGSISNVDNDLILSSSARSNMVMSGTMGTQVWTVATVNTGSYKPGQLAYVSDGDAGSPTLAMWDGTDWKRISLGATIDSVT